MAEEDLYRMLDIARSATDGEIKKAYRKLARELHPDRNKNNKQAEERFKKVSAAYAVLGDKEKRKLYDQYGVDGLRDGFDPQQWQRYGGFQGSWPPRGGGGGRSPNPADFGGFAGFGALEDIFENLFGGGGGMNGRGASRVRNWGAREKGAQIRSVLKVELMDVVLGKELEIALPIEGERKRLKVKVPRGIEDGQTIRLKSQGGKSAGGRQNGDLLLEIQVKQDRVYERKGMNLVKHESITVGQAYAGAVLPVETPFGKVKLSIPEGTQGGQKLRLKDKGIVKGEKKGDLHVIINIKIPRKRDEETEEIVKNLETRYS